MSTSLLVLLIIIALILLFLVSSANSTFSSEVSIEVDAPIDHSFDIVMDDQYMGEWLSSPQMKFERIENISGGQHEVGSKWKLHFTGKGNKQMEMYETVTHFIKNEHFGMDLEDKMFKFHTDIKFESMGPNKTKITEYQSGGGKSLMTKAMMRIFGGQAKKAKQKMFNKLKEVIERELKN